MKIKSKRNLRVLKVAGAVVLVVVFVYLLMLVAAPQLLQRLGTGLRNTFRPGSPRSISIATAGEHGHYYRIGNLIKKTMAKHRGREVRVQATQGSLDNIDRVRRGDADFALIQGGIRETEDVKFDQLTAVAGIGWQYVHILVPNHSGITSFKGLAGKRVSLGPKKSGNAALAELVFHYYPSVTGIDRVYTRTENAPADFAAEKMDALFTAYDLHAGVMEEIMKTGGYRLVPIPEAEAVAYTIPGCFAAEIPHSVYGPHRNIPKPEAAPFKTLKVKTLLITGKGMSRFVVQDVLNVLYSTKFIKQSELPELSEAAGRKVFDLPLHKAADAFYRRNDPITADKYEIGSALLAALLFIVSIVGYIMNRYKARQLLKRKENIVPYFEELLQYGKQLADIDDIDGLKKILDEMMAMQRRAEKEWLAGRLDTEHMENLYAIYGIRCANVFNKMSLLQSK